MRTEDGQMVYECLNGNHGVFGVLVDKYKEGIYALAYSRLGNFHDAQDIVQEAFIKAYQKLHTLRHYDRFSAWLCAITNNLCKNLIQSKKSRLDREYVSDQPPDLINDLSIDSHRAESLDESLREALDSLPEIYRQVLVLHYFSGMKGMDMARLLGVSIRTITERLRIGRERLKEEMITMMSASFKEQKLPAGFTFRIVELVRRIKINPISIVKGLPWGLSLATGIIITFLSVGSRLNPTNAINALAGHPLPSESRVLKVGEIPVDILKISEMTVISNDMGKGKGIKPDQSNVQNAFFMAPQGQGDTWAKKADMPTPRHGLAACVVNGKIYVFGGAKPVFEVLATVEEYDPATDKWAKRSDMPTARARLATCAVNGKIYAIGGWGPINGTVEEYNPETDKWTRKTPMIAPAERFAACALGEKIYTFGGWFSQRGGVVADVSEYDTVTDTWKKKANLPEPAEYFTASGVDGKIYIVGWFPNVLEYDPIKDRYTPKAATMFKGELSRLYLHSATVISGRIYVIGGCQPYGTLVAVYDPKTDMWEEKADMPTARCWLATSEVNGKIYAIGGVKPDLPDLGDAPGLTQGFSTVEEYDTGFLGINIEAKGKMPSKWGKIKRDN